MIGDYKKPKTKQELIRSLQNIQKLDFEVIELSSSKDKSQVTRFIDKHIPKEPISVILIK